MGPLVEFSGVRLDRRGYARIEALDAAFRSGERVAVATPPGGGWGHALISLVAGFVAPDAGTVRVLGRDVRGSEAGELRKGLGLVFRDGALISNLKVVENVALPLMYHLRLGRGECLERAARLLEAVGYDGDPWSLPGRIAPGAAKAVSVAAAAALGPRVLVLDSVFDGLDAAEKRRIAGFLLDYHGAGGRLLTLTAEDESDISLIRPDRILAVEGGALRG